MRLLTGSNRATGRANQMRDSPVNQKYNHRFDFLNCPLLY